MEKMFEDHELLAGESFASAYVSVVAVVVECIFAGC